MLDQETKRRIDTARDILVGKLPNPQSQVEQITIALIYKFMDDMDKEAMEFGGEATFFTGDYEKFSWTKIFDPKLGGFEMLALYGEAIVKLNQNPSIPQLFRDIFKNAYLPYRDPETLKMFLKIINEFHYDHSEKLGDAFEYLLSVLGSQGDAGQFRTPRHIIDFMVAIMQPKKTESICDPSCGTAGFLISAYKHILNENTNKNKGDLLTPDDKKKIISNFVGYDISSEMVRLSLVNLYLHGFSTPKIYEYDTLTSEDKWGEYFDIILANPPFMTPKGGIRPHKKFTMQANRSEVLFVDYIMEHINPTTGRAAIIVPEGIIFQSATAYKALRKLLVDKNYLYGVISLPAGLFQPYSGVKTSILLLDKTLAKKTDKILFTKIENDGYSLGSQRKELATSNLPDATNFIKQYSTAIRNNDFSTIDFENLPLNSLAIEKSIVAENGEYNLSGDRYKETIGKKQTKFEVVELSEVCNLITCGVAARPEYVETGVPFLSSQNVKAGQIVWEKFKYISEEDHLKLTKYNKPAKYDILYTRVGSYGEAAVVEVEKEFSVFVSLTLIKPIHEIINSFFLKHILNSEKYKQIASENITGIGVGNLNVSAVRRFKIPLPPLSIQQEIVSIINQYEKIIAGAKQVTQNYKPQIEINPNWEMVELGSVCEKITKGSSPNWQGVEYVAEGILFVTSENVGEGELLLSNKKYVEEKFNTIEKKSILQKGDVLTNIVGASIGRTAIFNLDEVSNINQAVCILRCNQNLLSNNYLMRLLNSDFFLNILHDNKVDNARANLSLGFFEQLPIPLPPLEEQQTIVAQIEKEQQLVNANKELITIYEQKIKAEINKLWAE